MALFHRLHAEEQHDPDRHPRAVDRGALPARDPDLRRQDRRRTGRRRGARAIALGGRGVSAACSRARARRDSGGRSRGGCRAPTSARGRARQEGRRRRSRAGHRRGCTRRARGAARAAHRRCGSCAIRWMAEDGTLVKAGDRVSSSTTRRSRRGSRRRSSRSRGARRAFARRSRGERRSTLAREGRSRSHSAKITLAQGEAARRACRRICCRRATAQERQLEIKRAPRPPSKRAEKELDADEGRRRSTTRSSRSSSTRRSAEIEAAEKAIDELVLNAPRDGIVVIGDASVGGAQVPGRRHRAAGLRRRVAARPQRADGGARRAQRRRRRPGRGRHDGHVHARRVSRRADRRARSTTLAPVARQRGRGSRCAARSRSCSRSQHGDTRGCGPGCRSRSSCSAAPRPALVVPRGAVRVPTDQAARVRLAIGRAARRRARRVRRAGCA